MTGFFRPELERVLRVAAVLALVGAIVVPVSWGYEQRQQARTWQQTACAYRLREVARATSSLVGGDRRSNACACCASSASTSTRRPDSRVRRRLHGDRVERVAAAAQRQPRVRPSLTSSGALCSDPGSGIESALTRCLVPTLPGGRSMRLSGKIGIVTAAASGMGRAGALRFAREAHGSRWWTWTPRACSAW